MDTITITVENDLGDVTKRVVENDGETNDVELYAEAFCEILFDSVRHRGWLNEVIAKVILGLHESLEVYSEQGLAVHLVEAARIVNERE